MKICAEIKVRVFYTDESGIDVVPASSVFTSDISEVAEKNPVIAALALPVIEGMPETAAGLRLNGLRPMTRDEAKEARETEE